MDCLNYYAFGQPLAAGSSALAYVSGGTATTFADNLPATGVSNFNLVANTLTATTSAAFYSGLNDELNTTANNDVGAFTALENATSLNLTATATSFTLDQPVTIEGANTLTINATGNLVFGANVNVTGGGALSFSTGAGFDYSIAPGDSISFTAPEGSGASLAINGTPYTLLYSMGGVQNINNGLNGDYALATSLNAATDTTTPASWTPIGTDGAGTVLNARNGFAGIFDGLGNTISNLTVDTGLHNYAGLFGYSSGTIRDIGLIGGSVGGSFFVGALGGYNTGTISNSYATGAVGGTYYYAGGLVGGNSGTISNSHATGAVSAGGIAGGLGGYNGGTISNSYATGAVSSAYYAGGLVGGNAATGTISNSYATGAVSGNFYIGGLGGYNTGTISNSYATGAVSGGGYTGGLLGLNSGTISASYWDTQTTGQNTGIGADNNNQSGNVTGLTTAQLQGALPSGFDSTVWSTGPGLYPYLTSLFPNGIAVVSGTAYINAGTVAVDANGAAFASASIGANGYYYAFGQPLAAGSSALAYVSGGTAATFADNLPATGVSNFNLVANTLTATTSAAAYSTLNTELVATANNDVGAYTALANATSLNLTATATSFTLDQPVTIADTNTLTINAAGNLIFGANVNVTGGGAVSFSTGAGSDYSFAPGDSISFTAPEGSGASLAINGTPYTLLYSMSEVQDINNTLAGGFYALAGSFDASSITGWTPLGTDGANNILNFGAGFAGTRAGLGNTISNLTINAGSTNYTGLFGYSTGTIRDIGLIGGSVTGSEYAGGLVGENAGTIINSYATGAVSGTTNVGGLVGDNGNGAITGSYAAGNVTGASYVGGLAGHDNEGTINDSHATGAVTASGDYAGGLLGYDYQVSMSDDYATGAVSGIDDVGGLMGYNYGGTVGSSFATGSASGGGDVGGLVGYNNDGPIGNSYAAGAVTVVGNDAGGLVGTNASGGVISSSYATGAVRDFGKYAGGLVGSNDGRIGNSYATGAVTGGGYVGGLVGVNSSNGSVLNTYATGAVSGGSNVGGFMGFNQGLISASFWDIDTSGQSAGIGFDINDQSGNVTGLTTAQMTNSANFVSWTFGGLGSGANWVIVDTDGSINNAGGATGGTMPFLSEYSTSIVNLHQLQLMELDPPRITRSRTTSTPRPRRAAACGARRVSSRSVAPIAAPRSPAASTARTIRSPT